MVWVPDSYPSGQGYSARARDTITLESINSRFVFSGAGFSQGLVETLDLLCGNERFASKSTC
jgi:hypothetical protein